MLLHLALEFILCIIQITFACEAVEVCFLNEKNMFPSCRQDYYLSKDSTVAVLSSEVAKSPANARSGNNKQYEYVGPPV